MRLLRRAALWIVAASFLPATGLARFCDDCPFPMHLATGKWRAANQQIEVDIRNETTMPSMAQISVTIRDAANKEVLASGHGLHPVVFDDLRVALRDCKGRLVNAIFSYDFEKRSLSLEFSCKSCRLNEVFGHSALELQRVDEWSESHLDPVEVQRSPGLEARVCSDDEP